MSLDFPLRSSGWTKQLKLLDHWGHTRSTGFIRISMERKFDGLLRTRAVSKFKMTSLAVSDRIHFVFCQTLIH